MIVSAKRRSEQHLIDQGGEQLFRSKLPRHWIIHEYRPDYGLDFTIEVFKSGEMATYETLGEHLFVQLKSVTAPEAKALSVFGRGNVEKAPEFLNREDKVGDLDTYRFQLETSELVTVERMGIGIPVLLVIADLTAQRCSFVCLNDYIDKILIPRKADYRVKQTVTIHVPTCNEVGTEHGLVALRWYAKRPKLLAAFQRFVYQYSELQYAEHENWRELAEYFAQRIVRYDFWDDCEMCCVIRDNAAGLRHFIKRVNERHDGFDEDGLNDWLRKEDVFELWRKLSLMPRLYEDVWREWFLPTALGYLASSLGEFQQGA